jgi:hypothetical protein
VTDLILKLLVALPITPADVALALPEAALSVELTGSSYWETVIYVNPATAAAKANQMGRS